MIEPLENRTLFNVGFVLQADFGALTGTVVADLNGDGLDDVAGYGPASLLTVRLSNGDGTFAPPITRPYNAATNPAPLLAGDFDGDGDIDMVARRHTLFLNNGDGSFAAPVDIPLAAPATAAVVLDYNHDGRADLAITRGGTPFLVLTNMPGGFVEGPTIQLDPWFSVVGTAASHSAGNPYLVTLFGTAPDNTRSIQVLRLASDGSVSLGDTISNGQVSQPAFVDIDGDGEPDLVWNYVDLLAARGTGSGAFDAPRTVLEGGSGYFLGSVASSGDLDGDGHIDLVLHIGAQELVAIVPAYGRADGSFDRGFEFVAADYIIGSWRTSFGSFVHDAPSILVERFDPTRRQTYVLSTRAAPTIEMLQGPGSPVLPPQIVSLTAVGIVPGSRPLASISFYLDSNSNGRLDYADQLIQRIDSASSSVTLPNAGGSSGHARWFAVEQDSGQGYSRPVSFETDIWFRVFYPEGWRNDTTINEYVPLVNPNDAEVSYRIVARYETGDRDQTIAEGVLAPHSRGGITVAERSHPESALVRLNTGYAIEVLSSAAIGATLSHYDSFGGGTSGGTANGEAFTSDSAATWAFADIDTRGFDFILVFNPLDHDAAVTFNFHDSLGTFTVVHTVAALRRGGLSVRDLGLPPDTDYSVTISADSPIVAAMSRYTADGTGFSSLGQARYDTLGLNLAAPLVEFRAGVTNRVVLYNNYDFDVHIMITSRYQTASLPDRTQVFLVPARRRLVADPGIGAPPSATRATLLITGVDLGVPPLGFRNIAVQVESIDSTRGDSAGAAVAGATATTWAFADGFLDSGTAGTVGFETVSVYNPGAGAQTATVRFLFTDGFAITRTVQIEAGRTANLDLHLDQELITHSQLNFFSTIVTGEAPLIAGMTHWDLFQGGGWATLGTPIGMTGILG